MTSEILICLHRKLTLPALDLHHRDLHILSFSPSVISKRRRFFSLAQRKSADRQLSACSCEHVTNASILARRTVLDLLVKASVVTTEAEHVQMGRVDLIAKHCIRKLVMGVVPNGCMKKKARVLEEQVL